MANSSSTTQVIVVGAGPSGLLLALLLANEGIRVEVFDAALDLDEQPRATHYSPPAVVELRRAGVLDEVRAAGFVPGGVSWRKLDGSFIAGLETQSSANDNPDAMVCLPLNLLGKILYKHLQARPSARVRWGHKVLKLDQDETCASVDVETPEGTKTFKADFLVGCDGANSQVRRALFGNWEFPGKTWDKQIVATNVYYDVAKYGWHDSNFIIDPEHWFMAARISKDGLWRVTYGEVVGLSREEYLARQPAKFKIILPGHPDPDEYRLTNFSPYKVHQRLAPKMRVGRVLLAADAAHLCNPFGGLGLTGGIVDVGGLYDCLIGIFTGKAGIDILDRYDKIRREKYSNMVDPISSQNFERLWGQDPGKAIENDDFLKMCQQAQQDPEYSKMLQSGVMTLQHDFQQYYS